MKVLEYLEHENFLTTLMELDNDKESFKKEIIGDVE